MISSSDSDSHDNTVANVPLTAVFNSSRIGGSDGSTSDLVFLLLSPLGVLRLLLRLLLLFIGGTLLLILPKELKIWNPLFRLLCQGLGLVIKADTRNFDPDAKLLIASHVSIWDRLAVYFTTPCSVITGSFTVDKSDLSFWNDADVLYAKLNLSDEEVSALQAALDGSTVPLLHFPELATTNGMTAFLKFHTGVFALKTTVQPIVIEASFDHTWEILHSHLGSSVLTDILWSLFVNSTVIKLKYLPNLRRLENESSQDFCEKLELNMSKASGKRCINCTYADKFEFKSTKHLYTSTSTGPLHVNKELSGAGQSSAGENQPNNDTPVPVTFGKTPHERMASYQQRKAQMIAEARKKYLARLA